ncbi:FecR family protein [Sphingobium sp. AP50]|uniref:FecR family protein n=1 Tax=Sphingobium sp. AP50 TaxID=1884369 RepID=UPI0008C73F60|nr:FecR domain-containing protein [Sphingobium sp. AP50]SEK01660.1 FecR family protein [Sphingobium sp. AP50]
MNSRDVDASIDEAAAHWVVRLASGEMDAAEMARFKDWHALSDAHRGAFDRERGLWQSLDGQQAAFASVTPAPRRRARRWAAVARPRVWLAAGAVAATLAFLAPGMMIRLRADEMAGRGEVRTVALADGSTAMLDSDAAIAIHYDGQERRIDLLQGKAWFDVKHGDRRPFRVAASGGVTQDIGTAFEVDRGAAGVGVNVTQGAVRVRGTASGPGMLLGMAERARYGDDGALVRLKPGTVSSMAAWRRGLIVLDGRSVAEAIAEIGRYRPGYTLTFADLSAAPRISGIFRIDAPDEALRSVAQMAGLQVMTLPGGMMVLRR